jgi:hypothetical protein
MELRRRNKIPEKEGELEGQLWEKFPKVKSYKY